MRDKKIDIRLFHSFLKSLVGQEGLHFLLPERHRPRISINTSIHLQNIVACSVSLATVGFSIPLYILLLVGCIVLTAVALYFQKWIVSINKSDTIRLITSLVAGRSSSIKLLIARWVTRWSKPIELLIAKWVIQAKEATLTAFVPMFKELIKEGNWAQEWDKIQKKAFRDAKIIRPIILNRLFPAFVPACVLASTVRFQALIDTTQVQSTDLLQIVRIYTIFDSILFYYLVVYGICCWAVMQFDLSVLLYRLFTIVIAALEVSANAFGIAFSSAPILFVIVILSVFSEEVWRIIGAVPWNNLYLAASLILLIALLSAILSSTPSPLDMIERSAKWDRVVATAEYDEWHNRLNKKIWNHMKGELRTTVGLLNEGHKNLIQARISRWRSLIVMLSTLLLLILFTCSYFTLFNLMLDQTLIAGWLGPAFPDQGLWPLKLGSTLYMLYSPFGPIGFMSSFLAILTTSQALTHENVRMRLKEKLQRKSDLWTAASILLLTCWHMDPTTKGDLPQSS